VEPAVTTTGGDVFGGFTVDEAKAWLRAHLDVGAKCPVCNQRVQRYRRTINAGMARSLISMHLLEPTGGWVRVTTQLDARSREEGKLRYWGLVAERPSTRTDGVRSGFWRVTDKGRRFVLGQESVPKYAHIYDDQFLGHSGPPIKIYDALGKNFSYVELMSGVEENRP
jgi:hypothetical protein